MRSIKTNEAPSMVWLLNDGAQTATVFPAVGDTINGGASFNITAGNAAVFARIPAQVKRKGGASGGGTLNWSASLIS
jgi:hypothetical protein